MQDHDTSSPAPAESTTSCCRPPVGGHVGGHARCDLTRTSAPTPARAETPSPPHHLVASPAPPRRTLWPQNEQYRRSGSSPRPPTNPCTALNQRAARRVQPVAMSGQHSDPTALHRLAPVPHGRGPRLPPASATHGGLGRGPPAERACLRRQASAGARADLDLDIQRLADVLIHDKRDRDARDDLDVVWHDALEERGGALLPHRA